MDPDVALAEFRAFLEQARNAATEDEWQHKAGLALDRAEALDEWMTKGGFAPKAWKAPADKYAALRAGVLNLAKRWHSSGLTASNGADLFRCAATLEALISEVDGK